MIEVISDSGGAAEAVAAWEGEGREGGEQRERTAERRPQDAALPAAGAGAVVARATGKIRPRRLAWRTVDPSDDPFAWRVTSCSLISLEPGFPAAPCGLGRVPVVCFPVHLE